VYVYVYPGAAQILSFLLFADHAAFCNTSKKCKSSFSHRIIGVHREIQLPLRSGEEASSLDDAMP